MATTAQPVTDDQPQGFYSTTSGTYFSDKDSLAEHYKSDFHKYNLKRKIAGLPPVTKEWFDARKEQLSSSTTVAPTQKFWYDPLTKKKFNSENTYTAHINSKKYKELLRKQGQQAAPEPVVSVKRAEAAGAPAEASASRPAGKAGYRMAIPNGVRPDAPQLDTTDSQQDAASDLSSEADSGGWETASDDEEDTSPQASTAATAPAAASSTQSAARSSSNATANRAAEESVQPPATPSRGAEPSGEAVDTASSDKWEDWDVCCSLFDNHKSSSMEANLEYMLKHFGFYLPDAEYLSDPAGLLRYLGAKLQYGHVPLYAKGDDANARQFASLHAVQRHMVDANKCKVAFEDNEEEYEEFYDWSKLESELADSQLAVSVSGEGAESLGYELEVLGDSETGSSGKILGSREFARYYKQHHKPSDTRKSVLVNQVVAQYRALGVATRQPEDVEVKRVQKLQKRFDRLHLKNGLKSNVIRNLPQNVPY